MLRNHRSSELIAFVEMVLLLEQQLCVAILTVLWFKELRDEDMITSIYMILVNASLACLQMGLILCLYRGVEKKDVYKCKIWYYSTLVMYCFSWPLIFFSVIFFPYLVQWMEIALVYIIYRGLSLKILKEFIGEIAQKNSQEGLLINNYHYDFNPQLCKYDKQTY